MSSAVARMLAVGLMSGTSLDGVDAVLCEIEGVGDSTRIRQLDYRLTPYSAHTRTLIKEVCLDAQASTRKICSLNFELGAIFAQAVLELMQRNQVTSDQVAFVASHGQTIYHLPNPEPLEYKSTLQIGEAAVIAYQTGIQVISDFRVMDVAALGEGAPLVPFSEKILYGQKGKTIGLQNIGGIGNLTVIQDDEVIAFDTGPGNMMIDEVMHRFFDLPYDEDGRMAASGHIQKDILDELMAHPFVSQAYPKSTGREAFGPEFVAALINRHPAIAPQDWVRTLTRFTAECIAAALSHLPRQLDQLIVGGGGVHNLSLMNDLRTLLDPIPVLTQEDLGFSSDAKEAIAFVILGNQTMHGQASNLPSATGAKRPVVLGKITPRPF